MRLGVDFGTSHTVAVLSYPDGKSRSILFDDGTPLLRSAVYVDPDGTIQVGRDAVRRAGLDPTRYEPNPKQRIDEQSVLLGDGEYRLTDLFAAVLKRVVSEVRRVAGSVPQDIVMTHPAAWGGPRREILTQAAAAAGLHNVRLIPEPVGAAVYFTSVLGHQVADGRPLGVFDFGGGTLDVAVVRRTGTTFTVLASGGLPDLGGVDLDNALVDHLGTLIAQQDADLWRRLSNPVSTNDRRNRQLLWDDVRGAKESLSRTTSAPVNVPETDTDLHLTREEFERLTTPLLQRAINETQRVLRSANTQPSQLAGLFLVGGSSRVPLVARMLHSGLGIPPTVLEQPEVAVAEGAAKLGAAKTGPGGAPVPQQQNTSMQGAPMSAPPQNRGPVSAPPQQHGSAPMTAPVSAAPMSPAPSSGYPVSAPPVSAAPMSPAPISPVTPPPRMPPRPPVTHTPPPQAAHQPSYSPPRHVSPAPPPQPQVIHVPYAVPTPVHQQPMAMPRRKKSKAGWVIGLIVLAVVAGCCFTAYNKNEHGDYWFEGIAASDPTGYSSIPESFHGLTDSWKPGLEQCWVGDPGYADHATSDTDWEFADDYIDDEATTVVCSIDEDIAEADYVLFVDTKGDKLISGIVGEYDLSTQFTDRGMYGTSADTVAQTDANFALVDGTYNDTYSEDWAVGISGASSTSDDLLTIFDRYKE